MNPNLKMNGKYFSRSFHVVERCGRISTPVCIIFCVSEDGILRMVLLVLRSDEWWFWEKVREIFDIFIDTRARRLIKFIAHHERN